MFTLAIHPISSGDLSTITLVRMQVSDLQRMYMRWADANGYKYKVAHYPVSAGNGQNFPADLNHDEMGGLKWAIVHFDAPLSLLENENGIHCFRQVSPYDLDPKFQTTYLVVSVTWGGSTPTKPIRFYDYPLNEVRDVRSGQTGRIGEVLNGNLDPFVKAIA